MAIYVNDTEAEQITKKRAKFQIDNYAGITRSRFPSTGAWLDEEYRIAYDQAQTYKAIGYSGTVPKMVADWLAHNDKGLSTNQEAADDIIATGEQVWIPVLELIREFRLEGKKAVSDAVDAAGIELAVNTAIAKMDAIPSP